MYQTCQLPIFHNANLPLPEMRPQDLAVQNSRVEGRAWTWAVQGPSGGCAVAV